MTIVSTSDINDLEHKYEPLWWHTAGKSFTSSGYGKRIPTPWMVKLPGNNRWRRVYAACFSNAATSYVEVPGGWHVITGTPEPKKVEEPKVEEPKGEEPKPYGELELPFPDRRASNIELAFGTTDFYPDMEKIPLRHRGGSGFSDVEDVPPSPYIKAMERIFFGNRGGNFRAYPREGIDPVGAWRIIIASLKTWGSKHEHKTAAVSFMLEQWFTEVWFEGDTHTVSGKEIVIEGENISFVEVEE